ncbi:protease SohB, partial [Woeseiaceae bacterium]|nr:protease SohB [Woeseiaceae bacterium]
HDGLEIEQLNKKYQAMANVLKRAILDKADWKAQSKEDKKKIKIDSKSADKRARSFIINFKGDLKATAVASLREEVSAILEVATPEDQVIVCLENHGGTVHEHGLAASQFVRIRDQDIPLFVSVDKVAASGGYLMACVANKIIAAPFAILGSIGVIAQLPNFNRIMDEHGIDFEMITAGQYKRNVTIFGKNTDEDRAKLKDELEDVHTLFKDVVGRYRENLDLEKVATGEHWYGTRALELGLVDELKTSDELLAELAKDRDLYRVSYKIRQPLPKRILANVDSLLEKIDATNWRRRFESRLPRS